MQYAFLFCFVLDGHLIVLLCKQAILHKASWTIAALLTVAAGQTWVTLMKGRTESDLTYL